jgi:hypothetical protein
MKIERVPALQTVQTVSVCSSPADAGEDTAGGLNGAQRLNGLNDLNVNR